jgi:hypothetical protein
MIKTVVRTARKTHICCRCGRGIKVGEKYASHVASPNDNDLGNVGWWRETECAACCAMCGRPIGVAA